MRSQGVLAGAGAERLAARVNRRLLDTPGRLAGLSTAALGGLFVVAVALDLFGESLFLTQLLEAPEHLVDALVRS